MPDIIAIIPARYGSTRFPGKVLADLSGKPVIRHVHDRTAAAETVSRVVVATDDERIAHIVKEFGECVLTSPDHATGTDRVAEAAEVTGGDIIVNVQGDEPLIEPVVIDAVARKMLDDDGIVCSTAASPIEDEAVFSSPNAVKVVMDRSGRALYFSRSPIPFHRDGGFGCAFLHTGIYCFRRDFLGIFGGLEPSPLEKAEKLEQLRMLEHGHKIGVVVTNYRSMGIDTPEDLERAREMLSRDRP